MELIQKIQKLLENSVLFTDDQKDGWLGLLPKMTNLELQELYGILVDEVREVKKKGINLISDPALEKELMPVEPKTEAPAAAHGASLEALKASMGAPATPPVKAPVVDKGFANELKREVSTPELTQPKQAGAKVVEKPTIKTISPEEIEANIKPVAPSPVYEAPVSHTGITMGLKNLSDIKIIDDLKKIQTEHLRQGELAGQIEMIRAKIITTAQNKRVLPYYAVSSFEQSPLYQTYLKIGGAMIADPDPDRTVAYTRAAKTLGGETLTLREFEAIADLRNQIEQL